MTPFGDIVATPERGTWLGNRGVLVDDRRQLVRQWQVRRWIVCVLHVPGRRRSVMSPRTWTELFFLDEATALAAGHRPCAACRYADYQRFRRAWARGQGCELPGADALDDVLHAERRDAEGGKRTYAERLGALPPGTMIAREGRAWLVGDGELALWTPAGYTARRRVDSGGTVDVLTPRSTVTAIAAGYAPDILAQPS